jgi:hypothetical protein
MAKHHVPPSPTILSLPQTLAFHEMIHNQNQNLPITSGCSWFDGLSYHSPVICGVIGFKLGQGDEGFIVVWGCQKVDNSLLFPEQEALSRHTLDAFEGIWWRDQPKRGAWFALVYPYKICSRSSSTMENMFDLASAQRILALCCRKYLREAAADAWICDPHGNCERTWTVTDSGSTTKRIAVRADIKSVEFLGRKVIDIEVTVTLVESLPQRSTTGAG